MVFYQAYQSGGHCSLGMGRTIIVEISQMANFDYWRYIL